MKERFDKPPRDIAATGVVLLRQIKRLLVEAEELSEARDRFLEAVSEASGSPED